MQESERKKVLDGQTKKVSLLLCLLPLLRYYIPGLMPIMFSDVVQLYLVFIGITSRREKKCSAHIPTQNALLLYGGYVVFATVLSSIYMPVFDVSSNITTILRLWVYIAIIILTLDSFFDKEYGFKIALKIAIINSCLTIIQLALYTVLGIRTSFLIPFLDAEAGYSNERVFNARLFRPTGLFYEPAQSVYYCIPLILILLFSVCEKNEVVNNSKRMNITYSIILTVGMICTESGAATVIALVIWALFVLYYFKKSSNIKGILLLGVFLIAIPFIFKLDFFVTAFNRGTNITSGSGSIRILRSFLTWIQFPFEYKIFGIGYANYSIYVNYAGFYTEYDYIQDVGYTNAAGQILSGLGIIGIFFLLAFFYCAYKCSRKDLPSKLLILYLFFSLIYSGIFLGIYLMIFLAFVFSRTKTLNNLESEYEVKNITKDMR